VVLLSPIDVAGSKAYKVERNTIGDAWLLILLHHSAEVRILTTFSNLILVFDGHNKAAK